MESNKRLMNGIGGRSCGDENVLELWLGFSGTRGDGFTTLWMGLNATEMCFMLAKQDGLHMQS